MIYANRYSFFDRKNIYRKITKGQQNIYLYTHESYMSSCVPKKGERIKTLKKMK